ncbi:JAB domain-containing protein [Tissierella sp. Yu-01]|uniref:JAB domain-containing protein n=1 Tax=Tissierella sp. Yu-01 TaxID=3035694 RepID=UPI00240E00AB|nr:JAB domain-containing protein [Tissierella sp. Yu-01]WFA09518.1 JAB domain-containing protein [Tissierella sp. Yu-01]
MKNDKDKPRKLVDIVKVKLCKEGRVLYEPRKISSPNDAVNLCRRFLDDLDREQMIAISLDTKSQPTNVTVVSVGTLNASLCHPREMFKVAILSNANSIIISHNHPSGDTRPSNEDIKITERLAEIGNLMGIPIIDHIIAGEDGGYYSFKEGGILK